MDVENSLALSETQVLINLIGLYKALGGGWQQTDVSALHEKCLPKSSSSRDSQAAK